MTGTSLWFLLKTDSWAPLTLSGEEMLQFRIKVRENKDAIFFASKFMDSLNSCPHPMGPGVQLTQRHRSHREAVRIARKLAGHPAKPTQRAPRLSSPELASETNQRGMCLMASLVND